MLITCITEIIAKTRSIVFMPKKKKYSRGKAIPIFKSITIQFISLTMGIVWSQNYVTNISLISNIWINFSIDNLLADFFSRLRDSFLVLCKIWLKSSNGTTTKRVISLKFNSCIWFHILQRIQSLIWVISYLQWFLQP